MASVVPSASGPRVSLRDIGLKLGVSHVTVSLALRGDPRISAARREEVQRTARELGYSPDPMLTSLSAYRQAKQSVSIKATIAWINQWEDPKKLRSFQEFDAYWNGARDYATRLGYRLEEFIAGPGMSPQRLQQILLARTIRGILIPPHSSDLSLPGFDWSQFAVVRFGISVAHPRAHIVTSDQLRCAVMAFERMWERGYRRIGYLTSRRHDRNTGGNFRAGYLSAQDVHVPLRRHLDPLALSEENTLADERSLKRWLRTVKPDGVITVVPALPELLQRVGCRVPEDLGVAALSLLDGRFDAGIDQKSEEVGRVAMATLAGLIQQNERGIPDYCRRILVEGRWVDGTSLPSRIEPPAGGAGLTRA
ncbi:MAG: LacI family DNA-binding transcriptional regulator [Opitutaceae bacterium]|nr:LacI family DNA-binding transcriptional regulator [Opitutaceae bacterium]